MRCFSQLDALRVLSRQVVVLLDLRRRTRELADEAAERRRSEEQCALRRQILEAIRQVEAGFLASSEPKRAFESLLASLLSVTASEYGFLGEVLQGPDGPFLRTHAITNIAWSDEWRALYAAHADSGLEFHNLKNLFGAVIRTLMNLLFQEDRQR